MIYGPYLTAQHSTWHVPTWIFMSDLSLIGSRKWSVNSIIGRQIAKFALAWWGTNMLGEWNWTFRFIRFIYYSNDFWITIYQLRLRAWNDTGERKPAEARASLSFACFVFCVHSNYYPLAIKKKTPEITFPFYVIRLFIFSKKIPKSQPPHGIIYRHLFRSVSRTTTILRSFCSFS